MHKIKATLATNPQIFEFRYFKMWIEQESHAKILETTSRITNKIYSKNKIELIQWFSYFFLPYVLILTKIKTNLNNFDSILCN